MFYQVNINLVKDNSDGTTQKAKQQYIIVCETPEEATAKARQEATPYTHEGLGEMQITSCKEIKLDSIDFRDKPADFFFKVGTKLSIMDENGKEKFKTVYSLVEADTIKEALHSIMFTLDGSHIDYEIVSIVRTNIDMIIQNQE